LRRWGHRPDQAARRGFQASAAAVVLICSSVALAEAKPADCLLQVGDQNFIDGPSDWSPDTDGSFTISAGDYFATLLIDAPGVGQGYWNETPGGQHAHTRLGEMRRNKACWVNARARICAWKKGERRDAGQ